MHDARRRQPDDPVDDVGATARLDERELRAARPADHPDPAGVHPGLRPQPGQPPVDRLDRHARQGRRQAGLAEVRLREDRHPLGGERRREEDRLAPFRAAEQQVAGTRVPPLGGASYTPARPSAATVSRRLVAPTGESRRVDVAVATGSPDRFSVQVRVCGEAQTK